MGREKRWEGGDAGDRSGKGEEVGKVTGERWGRDRWETMSAFGMGCFTRGLREEQPSCEGRDGARSALFCVLMIFKRRIRAAHGHIVPKTHYILLTPKNEITLFSTVQEMQVSLVIFRFCTYGMLGGWLNLGLCFKRSKIHQIGFAVRIRFRSRRGEM